MFALFKSKKHKPESNEADSPRLPATQLNQPGWEEILTSSLVLNCVAPSPDVILHAFDRYRDELYAPLQVQRDLLAELHAELTACIAALHALAPEVVERAIARHPFEFSHYLENKEDY